MINKKLNNQKIYILIIFLLIYIFFLNTNIAFCEESIITETTSNVETNYNYKKIFLYTVGFIVLGVLLYYTFQNSSDPNNFDIMELPKPNPVSVSKKGVFGPKSTEPLTDIQKEIIDNLTIKDYYLNSGFKSVNYYLSDLSDKIAVNWEVFNMDIPIFHMSNVELNTFCGITEANLTELYSLPSDSLVAFAHSTSSTYYQLITASQLIELITKYNIV